MDKEMKMDKEIKNDIQAAILQRLIKHLQNRNDVQNIDLMNLSGFCRNCLSKWYLEECETRGVAMDYNEAREDIYGMPYEEWKAKHQTPATAEQKKLYRKNHKS